MKLVQCFEIRIGGKNYIGWTQDAETSDFLFVSRFATLNDSSGLSNDISIELADVVDHWQSSNEKHLLFFNSVRTDWIREKFTENHTASKFFDRMGTSTIGSTKDAEFWVPLNYKIRWTDAYEPSLIRIGKNIELRNFPIFSDLVFSTNDDESGILLKSLSESFRFHLEIVGGMLPKGEKIIFKKQVVEIALEGQGGGRVGAMGVPLTSTEFFDVSRSLICFPLYSTRPEKDLGGEFRAADFGAFKFFNKIAESTENNEDKFASILLDPRDTKGGWVGETGIEFNSRIVCRSDYFVSTFTTVLGESVPLQWVESAAPSFSAVRRHFRFTPNFESYAGNVEIIFTPRGLFRLAKVGGSENYELIIGRHATERVVAKAGDYLRFHTGKPALLTETVATDDDVHVNAVGSRALLTSGRSNDVTTSWLEYVPSGITENSPSGSSFANEESGFYYAESATAPPFKAFEAPGEARRFAPNLARMNLSVGTVANIVLPAFPPGGLSGEGFPTPDHYSSFQKFDASHLSPIRQQKVIDKGAIATQEFSLLKWFQRIFLQLNLGLKGSSLQTSNRTRKRGVTPQGLLCDISDKDSYYESIFFGSGDSDGKKEVSLFDLYPEGGETESKRRIEIQKALRASESFLVAFTKVGRKSVSPSIKVGEFEFGFDSENDSRDDSWILLKLRKDRSLKQLLGDLETWSIPGILNGISFTDDVSKEIQNAIITHIENGLLEDGATGITSPQQKLKTIYESETWEGLLYLKINIPKMPSLLDALRPGINHDLFHLHHLGFDLLPAKATDVEEGAEKKEPKRLGKAFGMLDYRDDSTLELEKEFGIKVDELMVGFESSRINFFQCTATIGAKSFFDEKLSGDSKSITLKGKYRSQKDSGTGSEVNVFSLETEDTVEWKFDDKFIKEIVITRGRFVVSEEKELSTDKGNVVRPTRTELLFDGNIEFSDRANIADIVEVEKATFSGVGISFNYDYLENGRYTGYKAAFEAGKSTWSVEPKEKAKSLLSSLPVKFTRFHFSTGAVSLKDLNFTQFYSSGQSEEIKFGLEFLVSFGSLGNLVGDLKEMEFPLLIGWKPDTEGVCVGVRIPKIENELCIGFQQFLRLRAEKLIFRACDNGNKGIGLSLEGVKIDVFGYEFPDSSHKLDALMVAKSEGLRSVGWAAKLVRTTVESEVGIECKKTDAPGDTTIVKSESDSLIAIDSLVVGQRLKIENPNPSGVEELVSHYLVNLVSTTEPCDLLDQDQVDPTRNGWIVAGKMKFAEFIDVWFLVDDLMGVYGLKVEITDRISVGLLYEKISEELGKFSGELNLRKFIPSLNFGAAAFTLPVVGIIKFTDQGFIIDFGYPWNFNFSRSARLEFAIFFGAGGFYFGKVSARSLQDSILSVNRPGYKNPYSKENRKKLKEAGRNVPEHSVVVAGVALAVGFGRGLDLGILKAFVGISVFGSIDGAVGYQRGNKKAAEIWYVRGCVGVAILIEGEIDFVIIQARATIRAYLAVGITKKRVLALRDSGSKLGYLTYPATLFIEAGLEIRVEFTLRLGCVSISMSFEFEATYTDSFELESERFDLYSSGSPQGARAYAPKTFTTNERKLFPDDSENIWAQQEKIPLTFFFTACPTLVSSTDLGNAEHADDWVDAVVVHMFLRNDSENGNPSDFEHFCKSLVEYFLTAHKGNDNRFDSWKIGLKEIRDLRSKINSNTLWEKDAWDRLQKAIGDRFAVEFSSLDNLYPPEMHGEEDVEGLVSFPAWPEIDWHVENDTDVELSPSSGVYKTEWASINDAERRTSVQNLANSYSPIARRDTVQFVEFLRILLRGTLGHIEQIIVQSGTEIDPKEQFRVIQNVSPTIDREIEWSQLWDYMRGDK